MADGQHSPSVQGKTCTRCGAHKEIASFAPAGRRVSARHDGRKTLCRECVRARNRAWYARSPEARANAVATATRNQCTQKRRAKRKAKGLKTRNGWLRIRESAIAHAKRGREYWPMACRVMKPSPAKVKVPRMPWQEKGLTAAESYRIRYRLDAVFAQRERERISARRFLNPEYGAQWEKNRGRWLRAVGGNDGSIDRDFLRLLRRETHCAYCGNQVKARQRHLDHVWPLSKGGRHSADNLVMACAACNRAKRDALPLPWLLTKRVLCETPCTGHF